MKTKYIILVLIGLLVGANAEAQILKKIKKRAEKAVERTILNKTDEKASKTTEKIIDSTTKGKRKKDTSEKTNKEVPIDEEKKKAQEAKAMSIFGGGLEGLPDTYAFQYVIDMRMTTNKEEMDMQYFVQPDASYFGNAVADERANNIIVYDLENQAMVTFIDNGDQKMAIKMRMPFDADAQKQLSEQVKDKDSKMKDASIIPLPEKIILGFRCRGYQITQKEGVSKIYITDEAPVSFVGVFSSVSQNMPKDFSSPTIPFNEKSLMMEMEYISSKRKKDNVHMICTQIKEKSFAINKADYKTGM